MDAHALLTSQGWRGSGNSLHPTDNTIGLSRPLLVSRKVDNLGIGKKQHRTSDMWWMNAFDSSLKGLDTSKEGQVVQTVTSGGLDMVTKGGAKWVGSKGGLYASFVRGEALSGTLTEEESAAKTGEGKRKRGPDVEEEVESKEERRVRKAAKKVMEEEDLVKAEKAESKEERRARRSAKKLAKEEPLVVERETTEKPGTKEERKAQRAAKRARKEQRSKAPKIEINISAAETPSESKYERRERKRLEKLAQETKDSSTDDSSSKSKKKRRHDQN